MDIIFILIFAYILEGYNLCEWMDRHIQKTFEDLSAVRFADYIILRCDVMM